MTGSNQAARRLSEADHARVTAAVTAAERHTDAEIVTIVAERSDDYRDVGWLLAAITAALVPVMIAAAPAWWQEALGRLLRSWDEVVPVAHQIAALLALQIATFLSVALLFARDSLRFALVPVPYRRRRVRGRAVAAFRLAAEARTEARHGLLVYLSIRERMAEIIVDEGLMGAVGEQCFAEAMGQLVSGARKQAYGDGIAQAVATIGTVLARVAPKTAGDTDELPDRLIEL